MNNKKNRTASTETILGRRNFAAELNYHSPNITLSVLQISAEIFPVSRNTSKINIAQNKQKLNFQK